MERIFCGMHYRMWECKGYVGGYGGVCVCRERGCIGGCRCVCMCMCMWRRDKGVCRGIQGMYGGWGEGRHEAQAPSNLVKNYKQT